ncbi:MAG TPA: hypothetical protein VK200_03530 [Candidatus Limnocylindrales bacterium]|nr:hypothetical protein [Candidatus Limnocylindrales bacterium]
MASAGRPRPAGGVALSATLFGYLLNAAVLTGSQVNSPEGWRAAPEIFMSGFSTTIYALSIFTLIAVFTSAVRGTRQES